MRLEKLLLCFITICTSCVHVVHTDGIVDIVPKPISVMYIGGCFSLKSSTPIIISKNFPLENLEYSREEACEIYHTLFDQHVVALKSTATISEPSVNVIYDSTMVAGAYRMHISNDSFNIIASGAEGVYYAIQTWWQMIPLQAYSQTDVDVVEFPAVDIEDAPCFSYRGLLFDVSRHFFSVDDIKRTIDILAMHKMNRFHWHLTDDQGWRIEIKRYPQLTEVGGFRAETVIGYNSEMFDGVPYGGYYTQEEICEVVEYAARHFITIIPEIEMPGHALAALAAYPSLGCRGKDYQVWTEWGINDQVFCVGKDSTIAFMENVLLEVMNLFPSEYIHLGGDECPTTMWEHCPDCQRRIKEEHLDSSRALQGYLTQRMEQFLNKHGRMLMGWDEIMEGQIENAAIMSWRSIEHGRKAVEKGEKVVMSPETYCYLNRYQSPNKNQEPNAFDAYLSLSQVYSLNPCEGMDEQQRKSVLGVQANLWSEYIPTYSIAQYMLLPRLSAIAEVGWSNNRKDEKDFNRRLVHLKACFDVWNYMYFDKIVN